MIDNTIISLTSVPPRFKYLEEVIDNLEKQSTETKILINIPYEYKRYENTFKIPTEIKDRKNVIINRCNDYGSATKLLGALEYCNNHDEIEFIITVDDDFLYYDELVKDLLSCYDEYQNHVICNTGITVLGKDEYEFAIEINKDDNYVHICEGYAGVLYKKGFFKKDIFTFMENFPKEILYDDDIYISAYLAKQNILIVVNGNRYWEWEQDFPSIIKVLTSKSETYHEEDEWREEIHLELINYCIEKNYFKLYPTTNRN